jgi:hypothetical protein
MPTDKNKFTLFFYFAFQLFEIKLKIFEFQLYLISFTS